MENTVALRVEEMEVVAAPMANPWSRVYIDGIGWVWLWSSEL